MLQINELLAFLIGMSSLLHGHADFFILPDSLGSVVKHRGFDYVTAQFQILLGCWISHLRYHVLMLLNALWKTIVHFIGFLKSLIILVPLSELIAIDKAILRAELETASLDLFLQVLF